MVKKPKKSLWNGQNAHCCSKQFSFSSKSVNIALVHCRLHFKTLRCNDCTHAKDLNPPITV